MNLTPTEFALRMAAPQAAAIVATAACLWLFCWRRSRRASDRYTIPALSSVVGTDTGVEGVVRAAALGTVLSNAINNLPAYVAGEAVVVNSDQLLGLLIATNVSPLVTPWASLATIIWYERCRTAGVRIAWGRFALTGVVTAVVTLVAAEGALLLGSP